MASIYLYILVATIGQSDSSSVNLELAASETTTSTQLLAEGLLHII